MSGHVHCSTLPCCSGTSATAAQASAVLKRQVSSRRYELVMGCPLLAMPEEHQFLAAWPPPAQMAAAITPVTGAPSTRGFDWHASQQPCNRPGCCSTRLCARWADCNLLPARRPFVFDKCYWALPDQTLVCT